VNSSEVRREWAERTGEYSPRYYAYYGPDDRSERIRERLDDAVGPDASVLELGCSSGRHLAHLHDHGYRDLHGIEINEEAFDVMAEEYPDLADDGTFHEGAIHDVVTGFPDDRFDAVYSVETLQHLHHDDERAFAEVARIAADELLTVELEEAVADEGASDEGATDEAPASDGEREPSGGPDAVNYVHGEFPLYYRDWGAVFSALGWTQVEAVPLDRTTLREFRPASA